jgi:hypothetical protein
LCSPHSLQHFLDLTFGLRELLCIPGAQRHIRVGGRDPRIGFGDLPELHINVTLAANPRVEFRGIRTLILSLDATSSRIACIIEGTPAITITLPIQEPVID